MQSLFGHLCSGTDFAHDQYMRGLLSNDDSRSRKRARSDDATQLSSQLTSSMPDSIAESSVPSKRTAYGDHIASLDGLNDLPAPISTSPKTPTPMTSSLETISDITPSPHEPLPIPKLSPRSKRLKYTETRQAWNFLNNTRSEHAFDHIGSLPSSCPDELGDQSNEYIASREIVIRGDADDHMPTKPCHGDEFIPQHPITMRNTDVNLENDEPVGDSQISHPFSVSSSAFASQEQVLDFDFDSDDSISPVGQFHSEEGHESHHEPEILDDEQANQSNAIRPLLNRSESSRNRKAAYLAARADSFDAWASMSLLSAGNNHTEEEIEL